jgi:hypothetical protein
MCDQTSKPLPECLSISKGIAAVRIAHIWGHGDWHHPNDATGFAESVAGLNKKYGAGTHWLENLSPAEPTKNA